MSLLLLKERVDGQRRPPVLAHDGTPDEGRRGNGRAPTAAAGRSGASSDPAAAEERRRALPAPASDSTPSAHQLSPVRKPAAALQRLEPSPGNRGGPRPCIVGGIEGGPGRVSAPRERLCARSKRSAALGVLGIEARASGPGLVGHREGPNRPLSGGRRRVRLAAAAAAAAAALFLLVGLRDVVLGRRLGRGELGPRGRAHHREDRRAAAAASSQHLLPARADGLRGPVDLLVALALLPGDDVAAAGAAASTSDSSKGLAVGVGGGADVGVGPGRERADGGPGRGAAGLGEGGAQPGLLEEVGGLAEAAAGEVGRRCPQGGSGGGVEELAVWFFLLLLLLEEREREERLRRRTSGMNFAFLFATGRARREVVFFCIKCELISCPV